MNTHFKNSKKNTAILFCICVVMIISCAGNAQNQSAENDTAILENKKTEVVIKKELLYDQHTLADTFPYQKTFRVFQWDKIHQKLVSIESMQQNPVNWGTLQNYKNENKAAPVVKNARNDEYHVIIDSLGTERDQSAPLYSLIDTIAPVLYGIDGSLVRIIEFGNTFSKIELIDVDGEWLVPSKYLKPLDNSLVFSKVIMIDKTNQNIATLEKSDAAWLVRSMNPVTTGRHNPPYQKETPSGTFVVQEKKPEIEYYVDGTTEIGGYAPYATRFSRGAYTHGVPVNLPATAMIEFSPTLGTVPRSHMCVRNATSHAEFIQGWAPIYETIVFVFE